MQQGVNKRIEKLVLLFKYKCYIVDSGSIDVSESEECEDCMCERYTSETSGIIIGFTKNSKKCLGLRNHIFYDEQKNKRFSK